MEEEEVKAIKIIEVNIPESDYVRSYLSLFYDSLGLTLTEERVLEKIVQSYIELKGKVSEPYLTELVMSTDRRKSIASDLGISGSDLNNRIKSLRDKNIFLSTDELVIDPVLIPHKDVRFIFKVYTPIESLETDVDKEEEPDTITIKEEILIKEVKPIK